jgi:hypothetical protein
MNEARHDERLRLRTALGEPALDEEDVQALAHEGRLAGSCAPFSSPEQQRADELTHLCHGDCKERLVPSEANNHSKGTKLHKASRLLVGLAIVGLSTVTYDVRAGQTAWTSA